ncbi:STAS domain-containing protein [Nitratidesulfovibrio liaohensis]|uniref:Anti-sigma factor antagonist n=1 Tax=Nitratidesulfovibrio liaohensis TaxID=2604158 RepID=A0ABY9R5L7_9BACT|nr:STAS domain-containing protein [Nitratidesulfovibrio liaohensis]WMW66917.1 STAS domain-containing protein [Nitratidesulfovibrio liaohensis]
MEIATRIAGSAAILSVNGRMDAVTAPEFEKACQALLEQGHATQVADLAALEYISSAGLRSILSSAKKLKAAGGGLAFCGLTGMVDEVFRVSGFMKMFRVHPTVDAALEG